MLDCLLTILGDAIHATGRHSLLKGLRKESRGLAHLKYLWTHRRQLLGIGIQLMRCEAMGRRLIQERGVLWGRPCCHGLGCLLLEELLGKEEMIATPRRGGGSCSPQEQEGRHGQQSVMTPTLHPCIPLLISPPFS